jgi:hypothetical protein
MIMHDLTIFMVFFMQAGLPKTDLSSFHYFMWVVFIKFSKLKLCLQFGEMTNFLLCSLFKNKITGPLTVLKNSLQKFIIAISVDTDQTVKMCR